MTHLRLTRLEHRYAVSRLDPDAPVPAWALEGSFFTVSRTPEELSLLTPEDRVPQGLCTEWGWGGFKLEGPFDFALTGILTAVLEPLRIAGIGIFAVSTFDTDYVLVKADQLEQATHALEAAGHQVGP